VYSARHELNPFHPPPDIRVGALLQSNRGAEKTADDIRQIVLHGFVPNPS
jgi:hypothetical protein